MYDANDEAFVRGLLADAKRIDDMEGFLRRIATELPDERIGLEFRISAGGKFVVTVLGPDDCYYGDSLREAVDAGRNDGVTTP